MSRTPLLTDTTDETATASFKLFCKDCFRLSRLAIPMALSYDYSIGVFLITVLGSHLPGKRTQAQIASFSAIQTEMNFVIGPLAAALFALSDVGSKLVGQLRAQESDQTTSEEKEQTKKQITLVTQTGVVLSTVMILPLALTPFFLSKDMLIAFGQDPEVAQLAAHFLTRFAWATPAFFYRGIIDQTVFSQGETWPAMLWGTSSIPITAALSYWFGYGGLGIEGKGIEGLATGYVAGSYYTFAVSLAYILSRSQYRAFHFFNLSTCEVKQISRMLQRILRIGLPNIIAMFSEMMMSFWMNLVAGSLSVEDQAALTGNLLFLMFMILPIYAFGQSFSQEICRAIGEKDFNKARRLAKNAMLTCLLWVMPVCLLIMNNPQWLIASINSRDTELNEAIHHSLVPFASGVILDACRYNLLQQLRAVYDIDTPMMISIGGISIGCFLEWVLGSLGGLGTVGIGTGYAAGVGLAATGLFYRWRHKTQPSIIQAAHEEYLTSQAQPSLDASTTERCFSWASRLWHRASRFFSSSSESDSTITLISEV